MEAEGAHDERTTVEAKTNTERDAPKGNPLALARHALVVTCVVAAVALVLLLVWYAADLLLLVFAAVLVSVLLRGLSRALRNRTGLGRGWSLAIVVLALTVVIALTAWLVAGRVGEQARELTETLPRAVENLSGRLQQYEWGRRLLQSLPRTLEGFSKGGGVFARITGLASTTLGVVINVVLVLVVGLYLAAQPETYSGGVKRLLPFKFRERAGEVFGVLDMALWRWLTGRFALMLINGGLTAGALWLLGVPLALTLGLLAGVLNFIPNFGPIIAAVPALLIALLQSPQQALYVAIVYLVVQTIDAYVLTPLVDRKSVELPPVVTITAQVLLGLLFGFVGLLVAEPLTAALLILVKMLYVEDVLGDPIMRESVVGERDTTAQRMEPGGESKPEQV